MGLQRMDNVGVVVEDLPAAIAFFRELGLELEGQGTVEGDWAGRVTGLPGQRVEIAMMRTPDGHSRLELSRFISPPVVAESAPPVYQQAPAQYWYYCQSPPGYYPYVGQCPGGWMQVAPQPSAPPR